MRTSSSNSSSSDSSSAGIVAGGGGATSLHAVLNDAFDAFDCWMSASMMIPPSAGSDDLPWRRLVLFFAWSFPSSGKKNGSLSLGCRCDSGGSESTATVECVVGSSAGEAAAVESLRSSSTGG